MSLSKTFSRVSGLSRVIGRPRLTGQELHDRFWSYVDKSGDCWIWKKALNQHGYGAFNGESAHRFSYFIEYGEIPAGVLICHTCDNPRCVNPAHLFAGSPRINHWDMLYKNRDVRGPRDVQRSPDTKSKVKACLANKITEYRIGSGLTQKKLAKLLGVSESLACCWETGRSCPKFDTLLEMCSIFDCSLQSLLVGKIDSPTSPFFKSMVEICSQKYSINFKEEQVQQAQDNDSKGNQPLSEKMLAEGKLLAGQPILLRLAALSVEQRHIYNSTCSAYLKKKSALTCSDIALESRKAKSTVHCHLNKLLGAGLVDWNRRSARSIVPVIVDPKAQPLTDLLKKWMAAYPDSPLVPETRDLLGVQS